MRLKYVKNGLIVISGAVTAYQLAKWLAAHGYSKVGPFTNGSSPAVNKSFLDGVENWLVSFFQNRVIQKVDFGFTAVTTGGTTVSHSLGSTPGAVLVTPSGVSTTFNVTGANSSQMTITVGTNCNVYWLAVA